MQLMPAVTYHHVLDLLIGQVHVVQGQIWMIGLHLLLV
jgi:hypothetical protein